MACFSDFVTGTVHKRTIRSFVRREGRLTPGQQRALEELWPRYGIDAGDEPLDLDAIFGRQAPRHLEIGFGKGEALLAMAQALPEVDFIGIDVFRPGAGHLLRQVEQAGLSNVRVMVADAVEVLRQQIPPQALAAVYVFFPDPWHKKRHHKRRLIQPEFVDLLASRMAAGGRLHLATDWQDYAEHMLAVLSASPHFGNAAGDGYSPRFPLRPLTKFERRGQRLGHGVWDLSFIRR